MSIGIGLSLKSLASIIIVDAKKYRFDLPMTQEMTLGQHGETLAADYLTARGYIIRERNWHCRVGEIDLVAQKDTIWIFIEVKTRRQRDAALASITPQKRERLVSAVYAYLEANGLDEAQWRVDAIGVTVMGRDEAPQIEHVEDALDW